MKPQPDDRSAVAIAVARASQITSICLGMVIPGVVGYWIDQRLNTKIVFTLLGAVFGLSYGIYALVRITSKSPGPRHKPD